MLKTKLLLFFCVCFNIMGYTQQRKDKNLTLNKTTKNLIEKGQQYRAKNLDSAYYYFNKAYEQSLQDKDSLMTAYSLLYLGNTLSAKETYNKALTLLNESLNFSKSLNSKELLFENYKVIGTVYTRLNNYETAVEYYKNALKFTASNADEISIKNNLAVIYARLKNLSLALEMQKDIVAYYDNTKDTVPYRNKIGAYLNYGLSLRATKPMQGLEVLNKAESLAKQKEDIELLLAVLASKVHIFKQIEQYEEALKNSKMVLKMAKSTQRDRHIFSSLTVIIEIYVKKEAFRKALPYFNELSLKVKTTNSKQYNHFISWYGYKINANLGNHDQSYKYVEDYMTYQDSLITKERRDAYAEYAKKYETEKKITENNLLKKENEIKVLEARRQKTMRNYTILFLVMTMLVLGLLFKRFNDNKKTTKQLKAQNSIIHSQKIELEKSNANKQQLFGIIAHDLVNPFNAILGYTNILEDGYDDLKDTERKHYINIINRYATSNYNLTKSLLDWAKVQQDKLVVRKHQLNIKDIVQNAIAPYQVLADKKSITIVSNIPDKAIIEADQNMMQTVIGNLFVNAIKFTQPYGRVSIHMHKVEGNKVALEIQDNGIGMSQEELNDLFDITKVTSQTGTNNEKGHGLGLILCKEFMELQKGTLEIFSQLNKGSKVVLTI